MTCCLLFLFVPATYLFARAGLGLGSRTAVMAAAGVAASSLTALVFYQGLLAHLCGAPLMIVCAGALLCAARENSVRWAIAGGIPLAGLLWVYPEMLFLLVPALGAGLACTAWSIRKERGRLLRLAARVLPAFAVTAAAANPVGVADAIWMLTLQGQGLSGGGVYTFSLTSMVVPVTAGVAPYNLSFLFPEGTRSIASAAALFAAISIAWVGWIVLTDKRDSVRTLAAMLGTVLVLGAYLAFVRRYSYGFFKLLLYAQFLFFGAAAVWAERVLPPWAPKRTKAAAAGPAMLMIWLVLNISSAIWYGYGTVADVNYGLANAVGLSSDDSFNSIESVNGILQPGGSVLLDIDDAIVQMWAAYFLRNRPVSVMNPAGYFQVYMAAIKDESHNDWTDEYVLTDRRDIARSHSKALWSAGRFHLYPLRDYVRLGRNWYGIEGGTTPFRWLNNDGEVLLIRPSEKRFVFLARVTPGPGADPPLRTLELAVNGRRVCAQDFSAAAEIRCGPFEAGAPENRIVLHIRQAGKRTPADPRILNVAVSSLDIAAVSQANQRQSP